MSFWIDAKCDNEECTSKGEIFEVDKRSIMEDTPKIMKCPVCGSKNTHRVYGVAATAIAEGRCGTAKNGYTTNIINNHNSLTDTSRGKRVR